MPVKTEVTVDGVTVKVGDFFIDSWGYDQTNIDYYEVLAITPSGKSVKVRKVQKAAVSSTGYAHNVAPLPGTVARFGGEIQTKRLSFGGYFGVSIKTHSFSWAHLWDCKPHAETDSHFGH